jgi:hypothetical protein
MESSAFSGEPCGQFLGFPPALRNSDPYPFRILARSGYLAAELDADPCNPRIRLKSWCAGKAMRELKGIGVMLVLGAILILIVAMLANARRHGL